MSEVFYVEGLSYEFGVWAPLTECEIWTSIEGASHSIDMWRGDSVERFSDIVDSFLPQPVHMHRWVIKDVRVTSMSKSEHASHRSNKNSPLWNTRLFDLVSDSTDLEVWDTSVQVQMYSSFRSILEITSEKFATSFKSKMPWKDFELFRRVLLNTGRIKRIETALDEVLSEYPTIQEELLIQYRENESLIDNLTIKLLKDFRL